ncbi:MAG: hypothetical protein ACE5H9_13970 [Anaerolineae bacterium]
MAVEMGLARTVKQDNLGHLIKRRNVVGVGVGYKVTASGPTDDLAVVVNVARKLPLAQLAESDLVPKQIDGVLTDVVETGVFRAWQAIPAIGKGFRERYRPTISPGASIGHRDVTAGTFGCLVRRGRQVYILSNNHVLADVNHGKSGDPILQPGRLDGGTPAEQVATLADYIPLDFGGEEPQCDVATGLGKVLNVIARLLGSRHRLLAYQETDGINHVDAALAVPLDAGSITPEILEIGRPRGVAQATLGDPVQKSGRTTGHTEGRIVQIDVSTSVVYNGRAAQFSGQLMASAMSAPGDSGSAVLDMDNNVVGLLYAGSDVSTLINPIQAVLEALQVELVT